MEPVKIAAKTWGLLLPTYMGVRKPDLSLEKSLVACYVGTEG